MGPCLGNMGVDTPVECFFWLQMLHNLGRACQCTVIVNLPCARLPFSWLFTAECITLALVMKVEVHSLALCSKVIVHNTSTIKKSNKHHLCLRLNLACCLVLIASHFLRMYSHFWSGRSAQNLAYSLTASSQMASFIHSVKCWLLFSHIIWYTRSVLSSQTP
jgi:hypothetical protein